MGLKTNKKYWNENKHYYVMKENTILKLIYTFQQKY